MWLAREVSNPRRWDYEIRRTFRERIFSDRSRIWKTTREVITLMFKPNQQTTIIILLLLLVLKQYGVL